MSDKTKAFRTIKGPGNRHKNGTAANGIPAARVRTGNDPPQTFTPEDATLSLPVVDGASENGAASEPRSVRPVKARLGGGYVAARVAPDLSNGHANGSRHLNGNGASHVETGTLPQTGRLSHTGQLRGSDITGLRLKLKREEWSTAPSAPTGPHKRELPYFLMRHRHMRVRTGVGHTRAQAAKRRYGSSGPATAILKIMLVLGVLVGMAGGAGIGGVVGAGAWYISKLPPVTELHGIQVQTTKIYDRNGVPLYDIVDEDTGRRHYATLDQISPLVISATVAAEDANFFSNFGVDPVGIVRAVVINSSGKGQSGASTITQQLVRQVNLPEAEKTDRTFNRKLREAIQSVRFTQAYSKNDIMEMYLNENYYGHRAYGIDAAALTYFGKSAKDVTLPEAALLAGMPQAPTEYDPFVNPDTAKRRQAIVLDLMVKQGMIKQEESDTAKTYDLATHLKPLKPVALQAPHFVYYVKQYLESIYGADVSNAGLIVTTTLDLRVQAAAEKVAKDRIDELRRQQATNASIVIMKPGTGEILAMVGSVDYNNKAIDGQVNVATSERQPGSSFKPITYATAFKNGWTPGTVLLDTLTSFPNPGQKPYVPKNYDGRDHGWVTVREALGNSLNIPAVKAIQYAGVQNVIDTAHDMGIKGLNRGTGWYGLSLTLGGGEVTLLDMTNAYSTFANAGSEVDANPILKIEDPQGRIINRLDPNAKAKGAQALDPRVAYMITNILSDNNARIAEFGPNSPLRMNFPAAAKTGTTDDNRDSWTLGYTPDLTIGVWVGNSNNSQMLKVTGAIGAAVVWHNMMQTFYDHPEFVDLVREPDGTLQTNFVQPPGLVKESACSAKGGITDLFLKEAPPKGCTTYKDKNPQLHAAPSSGSGTPRPAATPRSGPAAKPTPLPGIIPLQP